MSRACTCSQAQVNKYQTRLSGPILDRLDIHIEVPRLRHDELLSTRPGESSTAIRERVARARALQTERFSGVTIVQNA